MPKMLDFCEGTAEVHPQRCIVMVDGAEGAPYRVEIEPGRFIVGTVIRRVEAAPGIPGPLILRDWEMAGSVR